MRARTGSAAVGKAWIAPYNEGVTIDSKQLNARQSALIQLPLDRKIWLEGIAGAGKTTVGAGRALRLLSQGVPAESILIFVPQRSLVTPYIHALRDHKLYRGGQVSVHTIGSLSLQMVEMFWFLVAERAGFAHPHDLPNFLSLELVQYFMTRVIEPLVNQRDFFNSVRIDRARLYSQIVDNMNKAALVGFPISEIGARLKEALAGGVEQTHIFDDAQTCAFAFRDYCLGRNLLDFSLYVEVFRDHVQALPQAQAYLRHRFRHLIVDNVEEDNPSSHNFLASLLPHCDSALLIFDRDAGFRRFLGADPHNARRLRRFCDVHEAIDESQVMRPAVAALGAQLAAQLAVIEPAAKNVDPRPALTADAHRYHPQMVDWVAERVSRLINEGDVPPAEIVVLAPFLSDVLRFGLAEGLAKRGIQTRSHRPSRALRDERAARTLLTLARLAHPQWRMGPAEFDIAFALMTAIDGLDLIRAKLLTEMLYRQGALLPFSKVQSSTMQTRVTFELGERYDRLVGWLERYRDESGADAIDIFFKRIFGDLLSRRGFGFHGNIDAGNICMNLVDSARNFRWSLDFLSRYDEAPDLGLDYVTMVERGVIANYYRRSWEVEDEDSVLIAPAYTFLLSNRPVDYQFWLNIGSDGWSRRLYQPLTHPYVLSRGWQPGARWTEDDEQSWNRGTLGRLLLALTRRCRKGVYLGYSELSESGYDQRGLLLETIQSLLRRHAREG
ncbi:MAG: hypothetical protein F4X02_06690 [Chloroflexi bacterium]|nr:hypothetical protein [Chloroflexota bacterium]